MVWNDEKSSISELNSFCINLKYTLQYMIIVIKNLIACFVLKNFVDENIIVYKQFYDLISINSINHLLFYLIIIFLIIIKCMSLKFFQFLYLISLIFKLYFYIF